MVGICHPLIIHLPQCIEGPENSGAGSIILELLNISRWTNTEDPGQTGIGLTIITPDAAEKTCRRVVF
jgi:hypothetical protein